MEPPRLSVVLPNYNHGAYLPAALTGLLQQSSAPFEIIVIDDASTDNSRQIIEEFARQSPSIRVFHHERNQGAVAGMNHGLELTRGEYVFFTASDDEVVPGLFEKSLRLLAQHPEAALCCAVTEWRETFSGLKWHMAGDMADRPRYFSPDDMVPLGKKGKLFIVSSSSIMRTEPLRKAGGFIPELRWHCDWFANFVTGFRHGICFVPEVLSVANLLPGSFYQSGHKKGEHRQVLLNLMERLNSEKYADVRPRIRESGALSMFSTPLLRILLAKPEYRHWVNFTFLRRTFRRSAELRAKRIFPVWLARWCLNRFYRRPARDSA